MINISYNIVFISFLIFLSSINTIGSLIVIPFKTNTFTEKKIDKNYNSTTFYNEYYYRDLYANIETGVPSKNVLALLDTRSHIFQFENNYLNRSSLSEVIDPKKTLSKQTYDSSSSISFKNISKYTYTLREVKTASLCSESFYLYDNLTMDKKEAHLNVQFLIDDNLENDLHIKIGLNSPLTKAYLGPPHFFQSLLDIGAIKEQSWTIKFTSKNDGIFILGEEPHKYQDIKKDKRYQRQYYYKTNSLSGIEIFDPISFSAQKIYLHNKNGEEIIINDNKGCYLNYHYGFIIGTKEYREYIKTNFFDELIDLNICSYELIVVNDNDMTNYDYYTISCDKESFKNYYEKFPNLYFFVYDYNYNYVLTKEDLFTIVNDKYYFLILFEKLLFDHPELAFWHLGLPFLEKYEFVLNYEKNNIGFYIPYQDKPKDDDEDDDKEDIKKDNKTETNPKSNNEETSKKFIIIIIIIIIVAIILIIAAFLVGKTLYQKRLRKANELEENFDYNSKENENINEIN